MQKKIRKKFFVSELIGSELASLNCLYSEQDAFHLQAMCWQAVPRLFISIRETFETQLTWQ